MVKAFILTPRGDFCIATFTNMDHKRIVKEMRMVAQARGYPIEIQWPHTNKPTVVSHRSNEELQLQRTLRHVKEEIWRLEKCKKGTVKKVSKNKLNQDIKQRKSEKRRIERKIRKLAGDTHFHD